MITRAYVKDIKPGFVKVRIPLLDGLDSNAVGYIPDADLSWAAVLAIPGVEVNYALNDVVIVGFQDMDIGSPIVLGHLKSCINDDKVVNPIITASTLNVTEKSTLPRNTVIGSIGYGQLQQLEATSE